MTVLIADGVDFRKKNVTRNKEHFVIIEGWIPREHIILNVCAPNKNTNTSWTLICMKQILIKLKREIDNPKL